MRREATGDSKRVQFFGFALWAMLFALYETAHAQQPKRIPRIGYLTGNAPTITNPDINADAFRQALRDLGYIEGKNILIEYRYADGKPDRLPILVAELAQLKVDVLISGFFPVILAARQATTTIPVVVVTAQDLVATGLVNSLARPGGNITGLTLLTRELSGKRLEFLKEVVPKLSRVGVLDDADAPVQTKAF